jgi:bla regulator protein BlaR1
VLAKAVTPPVWSSPTGLFSWMGLEKPAQPQSALVTMAISQMHREPTAEYTLPPQSSAPMTTELMPQKAMPVQAAPVNPAPREVAQSGTFPVLRVVGIVWGVGVVGMLGVLAVRMAILRRRIAGCAVTPPAELLGMVEGVCRELGVERAVCTQLCTEAIGPAVFGFVRPTLVLPAAVWETAGRTEVRQILAHEIVHVRRGDSRIAAIQAIVRAIWWFHPLVWWVDRQMNEVREMCCDAEVIASEGCEPGGYAQMLIDVARLRRAFVAIDPVLSASGAGITRRRLEYIMSEAGRMVARKRWMDWAVFAVCSLLVRIQTAL